jgi:hypothetical protein
MDFIEQLPFPNLMRMHFPGDEATDRGILLPLLVKAYAKTELLPEEGSHVSCICFMRGSSKFMVLGTCVKTLEKLIMK